MLSRNELLDEVGDMILWPPPGRLMYTSPGFGKSLKKKILPGIYI
ncbi:MAG: hypothetical protein DRP87_10365 [Spirochaetes bacterium]|nr:MAG: hypothetical protein DRP87_10365 [Spirochaetota bacterium]